VQPASGNSSVLADERHTPPVPGDEVDRPRRYDAGELLRAQGTSAARGHGLPGAVGPELVRTVPVAADRTDREPVVLHLDGMQTEDSAEASMVGRELLHRSHPARVRTH
jgi:hypothetical protein